MQGCSANASYRLWTWKKKLYSDGPPDEVSDEIPWKPMKPLRGIEEKRRKTSCHCRLSPISSSSGRTRQTSSCRISHILCQHRCPIHDKTPKDSECIAKIYLKDVSVDFCLNSAVTSLRRKWWTQTIARAPTNWKTICETLRAYSWGRGEVIVSCSEDNYVVCSKLFFKYHVCCSCGFSAVHTSYRGKDAVSWLTSSCINRESRNATQEHRSLQNCAHWKQAAETKKLYWINK